MRKIVVAQGEKSRDDGRTRGACVWAMLQKRVWPSSSIQIFKSLWKRRHRFPRSATPKAVVTLVATAASPPFRLDKGADQAGFRGPSPPGTLLGKTMHPGLTRDGDACFHSYE